MESKSEEAELLPGQKGDMDTSYSGTTQRPKPKKVRVKPTRNVSPHVLSTISRLKAYVWTYEAHWDATKQEYKWSKPARTPTADRPHKFKWSLKYFDRNLSMWGTFEEAYEVYEKNQNRLQGLGFLIEPYLPVRIDGEDRILVWLDFDNCRDLESGEIDPRVMEEIRKLDTYTEISPSGKGLRCMAWGKKHQDSYTFFKIDGHDAEIYGGGVGGRHLITFTGVTLEDFDKPIRNVQDWIDETVPIKTVAPKKNSSEDDDLPPEPLDLSDEELLSIMLASKDGRLVERFMAGDESLWTGESKRYKSRSHADQGFFRKLAFYTRGDKTRMRRIAFSSNMKRKKWDRKKYLSDTMEAAISYCQGNFYDPDYSSKAFLIEKFFAVWMSLKDHKSRRALGALLAMINTYGQYTRAGYIVKAHGADYGFPNEGLWAYASLRDLGIWMGEGDAGNISRIMTTLREDEGLVERISVGSGPKGSLYLLPTSVLDSFDSGIQHTRGTQGAGVSPHPRCVSLLCCESESKTYLKLIWTQKSKDRNRGLTDNQKLLIELALFGGMEHVENHPTFQSIRKNNLKSKVIKPVVEMGLLKWDGEESLKISEGFEEILHEIFVESGGERALADTEEKFRKEQEDYRERGEEANEENWGSEEEKWQAAVLGGELDWDKMPSQWELLRAYVSRMR